MTTRNGHRKAASAHKAHAPPKHTPSPPTSSGLKSTRDDRSASEKRADWLLDRQIDVPLYILLGILVAHALSGTSSFSIPHLSTHLPHSIQTLLPAWARHLPILSPFSTELPNASRDSKQYSGMENYWSSGSSSSSATTGYAGPFRSDAVGFGHPLTALHNFTRACLGLSYEVGAANKYDHFFSGSSILPNDLRFGQSYFDRYPWNSWLSQADQGPSFWARKYEKGFKDMFFVLTGVLVFTILRALVVRHVLIPLAQYAVPEQTNIRVQGALVRQRRRMCSRFAEQAWVALWGTLSVTLSLLVASQEPYWRNESKLWIDWPYTQLSGLTKFYYLLQTAFWVQQVVVINVEDRRNDHWQMFSHHVVTIMLLLGSYASHFTPIGNIILILMDPCDVLLSLAKCLRYAGKQVLCDVFFGLFMLTWIVTRHILYGRALYSCMAIGRYLIPEVPGATFQQYWGFRTFIGFSLVCLLWVLQVILCLWLVMIIRVAWRVVSGQGADDSRSDVESDEDEDDNEEGDAKAADKAALAASDRSSITPSSSQASALRSDAKRQVHKRRKG